MVGLPAWASPAVLKVTATRVARSSVVLFPVFIFPSSHLFVTKKALVYPGYG
jgi:hypothetical protein